MKRIAILFACILALFALTSCDENQQVIGILRAPSELGWLTVTVYAAGDLQLIGGVSMSPSFRSGVFDYTVYVAKDTARFSIDAGFDSEGTVTGFDNKDQKAGMDFFFSEDSKVITLTAQLKHMERAEYRLTIVRQEPEAVARNIKMSVTPAIGTFFVGSGTIPVIKVTADLPPQGGVLSYQWYVNDQDTSRGGSPISGADSDTYTMILGETLIVRTVYYYVEVTNTIDGRVAVTESIPCKVTFLNKGDLDEKSWSENYMVPIPAGAVNTISNPSLTWATEGLDIPRVWNTPGFEMGKYPVTWELWNTVLDYADTANYRFARSGNQGGGVTNVSTNMYPRPVGNFLNPVTNIGWREAVVWCNAYSEMDGKQPVYRDKDGNVLRNSRLGVEYLIDSSKISQYNGYRLPTNAEWMYAARGANPSAAAWSYAYPGTGNRSEVKDYLWADSPGAVAGGAYQTGEVGSMKPNSIGLYDMYGMVNEWIWYLDPDGDPSGGIGTGLKLTDIPLSVAYGLSFTWPLSINDAYNNIKNLNSTGFEEIAVDFTFTADMPGYAFMGLRLARNRN